jgi:hypothetical protein
VAVDRIKSFDSGVGTGGVGIGFIYGGSLDVRFDVAADFVLGELQGGEGFRGKRAKNSTGNLRNSAGDFRLCFSSGCGENFARLKKNGKNFIRIWPVDAAKPDY